MTWLILAAFVLLMTYELWAAFSHRTTLSEFVWRYAQRWPLLPFAFGLLMGHFFWQR